MPNFNRKEIELETRLDKWLYFIKHLEDFQSIPTIIADEVFNQAFEKAELAKFGQAELVNYENSLKIYRDLKGVINTAFDDGKLERSIEIAIKLKAKGMEIDFISETTGLTKEEIERL
jgi:predicted transposase/invertase (TIGR01784 family)